MRDELQRVLQAMVLVKGHSLEMCHRYIAYPVLQDFPLPPLSKSTQLGEYTHGGLVSLFGRITSISEPQIFIKYWWMECETLGCPEHGRGLIVEAKLPVFRTCVCQICSAPLKEITEKEKFAKKRMILFEILPSDNSSLPSTISDLIQCTIYEPLDSSLELGSHVILIGFCHLRLYVNDEMHYSFEVNNVISSSSIQQPMSGWRSVEQQIPQWLRESKHGLSHTLAHMFAGHISPPGSLLIFKLVLLIALVLAEEGESCLSVLFLCNDEDSSHQTDRIIRQALHYAERGGIVHSETNSVCGDISRMCSYETDLTCATLNSDGRVTSIPQRQNVNKVNKQTGMPFMSTGLPEKGADILLFSSGSLHLAAKSFAYFPRLTNLKSKEKDALLAALDRRSILLSASVANSSSTSSSSSSKASRIHREDSLQCCVFALVGNSSLMDHKATNEEESFETGPYGSYATQSVASGRTSSNCSSRREPQRKTVLVESVRRSFDLVLSNVATGNNNEKQQQRLESFLLEQAMSAVDDVNDMNMSFTAHFRECIHHMKKVSPELSESSQCILKAYFLRGRQIASNAAVGPRTLFNSPQSPRMPNSAMRILASLSRGIAKLNSRWEVLVDDAILAIQIYEMSLEAAQGKNFLHSCLTLEQDGGGVDETYVAQCEEQLAMFTDSLHQFINQEE